MKILLFFALTFFALTAFGQDYLLDKYERTYFHQRKEYNWKQLGIVYMEYEESFNMYSSGRDNLNSAKNLAIRGVAPIGLGIGTMVFLPENYGLVYGSIILGSGVLVELVALIFLVRGKLKLRKARREFNFEMFKRYGYNSGISLAFGGTKDGVGLTLQF